MKSPQCPFFDPVALQILAYLRTHRDAQDTLEGIAEWWLLERRIRPVIKEVKAALDELAAQGMVIERTGCDGQVHYRLNPRKQRSVARHVQKITSMPSATSSSTPDGSAAVKPIKQC